MSDNPISTREGTGFSDAMPGPVSLLDQALAHVSQGDLHSAERCLERYRRKHPQDLRALEILALIRHQGGRTRDAVTLIASVLEQDPDRPDAWDALGTYVATLGEPASAANYHREALRRNPLHSSAPLNLANALTQSGDLDQAIPAYEAVLVHDPTSLGALNGLGVIAQACGRLNAAESFLSQAVEAHPTCAVAWQNLGAIWSQTGHAAEARNAFERALELDPNSADTWQNLGHVHLGASRSDEAADCYQTAARLNPHDPHLTVSVGHVLAAQGYTDEARATFDAVGSRHPVVRDAARLRSALTIPIISSSTDEIHRVRARVESDLTVLRGLHLDDPLHEVGVTPFYFAFHGQADACLNAVVADAFLRACPTLATVAPHLGRSPHARPRVGILSAYLRHHTVGKLMEGLLRELPRDAAELILIRTEPAHDTMARRFDERADSVVHLAHHLAPAQAQLAALQLDTLIYPEVGMDPMTYALSYGRWARRSVVFWGHPVGPSTGGIDSFISSDLLERPGSEPDYAEDLQLWPTLPAYYDRPDVSQVPAVDACRQRFSLPPDQRLYLCPQSLFKLHPEYDAVLDAILERDPSARIGLIEGLSRHWRARLEARWARSAPRLLESVVWFPRVSEADFLALLRAADVVLDPIHFGGGNTSYEALALGVPIVTWPGPYARSRVTQACYRQMGIAGPVAASTESYVDLAFQLANHTDLRHWHTQRIQDSAYALYQDRQALARFTELCSSAPALLAWNPVRAA